MHNRKNKKDQALTATPARKREYFGGYARVFAVNTRGRGSFILCMYVSLDMLGISVFIFHRKILKALMHNVFYRGKLHISLMTHGTFSSEVICKDEVDLWMQSYFGGSSIVF